MDRDPRLRRFTTDYQGFLGDPSLRPTNVPTVIAQSWDRSHKAGVVPDDASSPRLQYVEDLDLQRRLVQCAAPVLDRLHDDLTMMPLSVALTDEHAQVMLRRDSDPSLAARLDGAQFAPGFSYAEDVMGTNGVGTAIETGMAVYIDGPQHYRESVHDFTCAGAPIHNPLTRRLEGLIDISCLAKDANPLMRQLALGAARDIESALRSTGSTKQQIVLGAFLAACRRKHTAVYSLSCGIFMSNALGARLLDPIDEAFLREEAHGMLGPSTREHIHLTLPSGQVVAIRRTLVDDGIETAGVVLEVEREQSADIDSSPVPQRISSLPGSAGGSLQWTRCRGDVIARAESSANLILRGERGSGKTALARGAHLHKNPQAQIAILDCKRSAEFSSALLAAIDSSATTIVLCHIDTLSAEDDASAAAHLAADQRGYPLRWLVATLDSDTDACTSHLAQLFAASVDVPGLRHHPEDVPTIARMHLGQLAPRRETTIDKDALAALKRYSWPGNITELVDALRHALRVKPAGPLTPSDFPPAIYSAPKREITSMENAERDAIVAALRAHGGNRVKAAAQLGIARSSLYRKISTYGIHV